MEILPAIDLRGGKVVRLQRGDYGRSTQYSDDPAAVAARFVAAGARWIHVVDLDAALTGKPANTASLSAVLAAARQLGAKKGTLLAHTNSNEVMLREMGTSSRDSVGYAAIVF